MKETSANIHLVQKWSYAVYICLSENIFREKYFSSVQAKEKQYSKRNGAALPNV